MTDKIKRNVLTFQQKLKVKEFLDQNINSPTSWEKLATDATKLFDFEVSAGNVRGIAVECEIAIQLKRSPTPQRERQTSDSMSRDATLAMILRRLLRDLDDCPHHEEKALTDIIARTAKADTVQTLFKDTDSDD